MIWGPIFKTTNIFLNILSSTNWLQSKRKSNTRNLLLFVGLRSYNDKSKFKKVFKNSASKLQHVLFANEPCLSKMLAWCFSSNIHQYIEKNPVENLCKVLEIELKTYVSVDSKFVFEKTKFKVFALDSAWWFHSLTPRSQ